MSESLIVKCANCDSKILVYEDKVGVCPYCEKVVKVYRKEGEYRQKFLYRKEIEELDYTPKPHRKYNWKSCITTFWRENIWEHVVKLWKKRPERPDLGEVREMLAKTTWPLAIIIAVGSLMMGGLLMYGRGEKAVSPRAPIVRQKHQADESRGKPPARRATGAAFGASTCQKDLADCLAGMAGDISAGLLSRETAESACRGQFPCGAPPGRSMAK